MDEKIKDFWENRSKLDSFLWQDLSCLNASLTNQYLKPGSKILDLGCGDGGSTRNLNHPADLTLVDYVRATALAIPANAVFIQEDIRKFQTKERFDLITLYGVANSFNEIDISRIYHMCCGWLKSDGVLLVKHQCGRIEDVFVDKFSEALNANYCAYYHSVDNHSRMLRRAGFDVTVSDPYPAEKNKWDNTAFKAFLCRKNDPKPYSEQITPTPLQGLCPRGPEIKIELLRLLKSHLDAHDIPFHIMFGTLLGAVREKDFIKWDNDIDVAILGRFQNRLAKIVNEISPLKLWRIGDYYCSLALEGELLDIYTYTEEDHCYSYCGGFKRFFDEDKLIFDSPSKLQFKGMDFLTVNDPVGSLVKWYGPNWTVPNDKQWPDWCACKV